MAVKFNKKNMFLEFKKEDGKEILDTNSVEYACKTKDHSVVYLKSCSVVVIEQTPENAENLESLFDYLRNKQTLDEYQKGLEDGRKEILFALQIAVIEGIELPIKEYKKSMCQLTKDLKTKA